MYATPSTPASAAVMPQRMADSRSRPAAGLAWLGRHGTNAVAVSILLGIALPPLGALIRPFFPETVFLLLCLAFLRVDPGALRAQLARPRLLLAAAVWTMLVVPVLVGLGLRSRSTCVDRSPALLLALMLNVVAPPIFASPALAALMGLNAAITLALLLACTAATPFLAPALVAAFVGPAVTFSPLALGLRLVLMLAGAACVAIAVRAVLGKAMGRAPGRAHRRAQRHRAVRLRRGADGRRAGQHHRTPAAGAGLAGADDRGDVRPERADRADVLARRPAHRAAARACRRLPQHRPDAGGRRRPVPELVWLYIALLQIPIYALPLIMKPLLRRLSTG